MLDISIDTMVSVKLPSVNYFWQIQDDDIQDGVPLLSCVQAPLCPVVAFYQPLYWKAADDDDDDAWSFRPLGAFL